MRCEIGTGRRMEEKEVRRKTQDSKRAINEICGKYSKLLSNSDKFLEEKRAAKEKW